MECNREEAARAKEIAEKKFESNDYMGAKKFALKAQSLYPGLDGIQHMLASLNVYIASEDRVDGISNWYMVLDVQPNAEEETIKKQYRKLALVLHPDKNKSIGADGAFKLISAAWTVLSDKAKRSDFDKKRNEVVNMKSNGVTSTNKSTTTPKRPVPKPRACKNGGSRSSGTKTTTPNQPNYSFTPTFWTVCHRCKVQHEYSRMYLHLNLVCPFCNLAYYAYEYPPPSPKLPNIAPHPNHILQNQFQSMPYRNYFEQNHAQFMPFPHIFQPNQAHYMPQPNHSEQNHAQSVPWYSGSSPPSQTNTQWRNPFCKTNNQATTTLAQETFEKSNREREKVLNATCREHEEKTVKKRESEEKEAELKRKMEKLSDFSEAKRRKADEDPVGGKPQGAKMD